MAGTLRRVSTRDVCGVVVVVEEAGFTCLLSRLIFGNAMSLLLECGLYSGLLDVYGKLTVLNC